jgi:hypothetical protein
MHVMAEKRFFPNINRVSVLASAILLAYTLAGFISFPARDYTIQLLGIFLEFQINAQVVIAFFVAGLSATGADWLVREHPSFQGKWTIQHWLLPALVACVIGLILFQVPFSFLWWIIFAIGGTILILVLIAEYIVVDPDDVRHIPAVIGLTAISFALFLTLAITIRAAEIRLYLLAPTISLGCGLSSLRAVHLRLHQKWAFTATAVIAVLIGQLSAVLNYIKIEPITFGLVLLGPAYALTSLVGGLLEKKYWRQVIVEPVIVLVIVWGFAVLMV